MNYHMQNLPQFVKVRSFWTCRLCCGTQIIYNVVGRVLPDFSDDRSTFIFMVKHSKNNTSGEHTNCLVTPKLWGSPTEMEIILAGETGV
jgi:hypothetical protein